MVLFNSSNTRYEFALLIAIIQRLDAGDLHIYGAQHNCAKPRSGGAENKIHKPFAASFSIDSN